MQAAAPDSHADALRRIRALLGPAGCIDAPALTARFLTDFRGLCVIVSPDELNEHLRTVVVAPMTTSGRAYPWRIRCRFQNRSGYIVLDQARTVDRERLVKRLGVLTAATVSEVLSRLQELFAE